MQGNLSVYEQPLNERIRAFLRLEFLFERTLHYLHGTSAWDSRATLDSLLDIIALLGRADLRTELIKELERHAVTLETLASNPGVDPELLEGVLNRIRPLISGLRGNESSPCHELRQNDLLSGIAQRNSIPAGTCSFDIPGLQHWLQRPAAQRSAQLGIWLGEFDLFRHSVGLCLEMIRNSASSTRESASNGFFQRSLDGSGVCQMIRVLFPRDAHFFPEISGGRHRFSIRFLEQPDTAERPVQISQDVEFELQCCMM